VAIGLFVLGAPVAADAPSSSRARPSTEAMPFHRVGAPPTADAAPVDAPVADAPAADAPVAAPVVLGPDVASSPPPAEPEGWIAPADVPARLVLVGDSLAQEVTPLLQLLVPQLPLTPKFWGGTAPCDWVSTDLEADPTSVVVITFTGNSLTPCMEDGAGGHLDDQALVDRYGDDVGALLDQARRAGARVVLVGQPRRAPSFDDDAEVEGLNDLYRSLAAAHPFVSFVDAGATVETPDGQYTDRLPCTTFDTDCAADGTTVVRGDGVHFCPDVGKNPCDIWASGAFRFGMAIAGAVNAPADYD
jgi:hypothetical protein